MDKNTINIKGFRLTVQRLHNMRKDAWDALSRQTQNSHLNHGGILESGPY